MERGLGGRIADAVRGLTPGYFALVMATGIISVGLNLTAHRALSVPLLWVTVAAFVVLLVLNICRLIAFREALVDDFEDPRRAFGFFTVIAGTNILGVRLGAEHLYLATAVLFIFALILWLVLGYIVPWSAVLSRSDRPLVATANGTWFIWVVAAQSVAVAAATLEPVYRPWRARFWPWLPYLRGPSASSSMRLLACSWLRG
jgi:tellurite resistance protein TehA-like permease